MEHPFTVTIHGPRNSESWSRETAGQAVEDMNTFVGIAEERSTPLLAVVRDRRGILIARAMTPDYEPSQILPGVVG